MTEDNGMDPQGPDLTANLREPGDPGFWTVEEISLMKARFQHGLESLIRVNAAAFAEGGCDINLAVMCETSKPLDLEEAQVHGLEQPDGVSLQIELDVVVR